MRYRTMFFGGVIIIALIALTAIMISERNTSHASIESCNPMNPNCNYQIKSVLVVQIGTHECKEGHVFYTHVTGF